MSVSGILVLDKPENRSSAFVARLIGRKIGAGKVGHLGTLDPFATGVLPIALNDATKLIPYIKPKQKTYVFEMVFGRQTDTSDITGNTIRSSENIPRTVDICHVLQKFTGQIKQIPSPYSAIKVNGKRAYELARKGQKPVMKPRIVDVFSLRYIAQTSENSHILEACVSPGTYIRNLSEDIAYSLNSVAYLKNLRRIKDGIFDIAQSVTMDELEEKGYNVECSLCKVEDVLDDIPVIFTDSQRITDDLGNGRPAEIEGRVDGMAAVVGKSGFFAIVEIRNSLAFPKRVIRKCN